MTAPSCVADLTAPVRPLVVGLDIALGTTGIAGGYAGAAWTDHLRSGARRGEERLNYLVTSLASYYRGATLAVIEGPAYGRAWQAGHDELAAARWMIRCDLWKRGIPCAVVSPHGRTVYATGKARWQDEETGHLLTARQVKGLVRLAAAQRYGVELEGPARYDEADALVLAAMGLHWLGDPLAEVPASHARALEGVAWPEREAVAA
jgi:hypothetical protein